MARLLTALQRARIDAAIRDHHLAFIAEVFGADAIGAGEYKRLKEAGKIGNPAFPVDAVTAAHLLGMMSGEDADSVNNLTLASAWEPLATMAMELSPAEKEAVIVAKDTVAQYVRGLGNKLEASLTGFIADADHALRHKRMLQIREEVKRGVEGRKTAAEVSKRLREVTKDSRRNWLQISTTEMHNAMEEGRAVAMLKRSEPGEDPLVYKRPRPDACPFCVLLYLKDKKVPRVFPLSELMANGTNVGRKAKRPTLAGVNATEWRPVLGAMHPWCACTLHRLPPGYIFDADGNLVRGSVTKAMVDTLDVSLRDHDCIT